MNTPDWTRFTAPTADDIADMAVMARDALPTAFAAKAKEVIIRVEELASDEMLAELDMDNAFELSGLYDGIPLTQKSVFDQPDRPDAIWLFRRAILDEWAERESVPLMELVAHIYVHELAHHLGWSDDDIAQIDRWWE